jgi:hypothetical protein
MVPRRVGAPGGTMERPATHRWGVSENGDVRVNSSTPSQIEG